METLKSLEVELRSSRVDNEIIFKAHEKQEDVNTKILQSLLDLQVQK